MKFELFFYEIKGYLFANIVGLKFENRVKGSLSHSTSLSYLNRPLSCSKVVSNWKTTFRCNCVGIPSSNVDIVDKPINPLVAFPPPFEANLVVALSTPSRISHSLQNPQSIKYNTPTIFNP